jgi:predicted  nucleic acid-binding Zn-ribbon protein
MKMKKKTIMVLITLFLMIVSTYAAAAIQTIENGTQLYVNPDYIVESVGATFTISVEISDVIDFYGFDIKFSWDPSILGYLSHTPTIPVETYPEGVLHETVLTIVNTVDDVAGTYNLAASTLGGPAFTGSGKVFEITFEVLSEGSSTLEIYESDLADIDANQIPHTVTNGLFETPSAPPEVHDIAVTSCTPSPTSAEVGTPVDIDVTIENQGDYTEDFNIEAFYDSTSIGTTSGSLTTGASNTYTITWDTTGVTPGTYTTSVEVTLQEGEDDDSEDNFCEYRFVEITEEPLPPPVDTVSVTVCPEFSTGDYPEWKYFTITNLGMAGIVKIIVVLPETTPMLEPVEMRLKFIPDGMCPDDACGWMINFHENDREIMAHSTDPDRFYLPRTCSAILKVKFGNGPSNCLEPIKFNVDITDKCGVFERRTVYEYIDQVAPLVEITFPGPESLTINPDNDYVFVKKTDGNIWVQKPDGTQTKTDGVLIEGTVQDPCPTSCPYASGVNRVEIWILFGTSTYVNPSDAYSYPDGVWVYMGDAILDCPYIHEPCSEPIDEDGLNDNCKERDWWWRVDPSRGCQYKADGTNVWVQWIKEEWYAVKAVAFDNAVSDIAYWEIHQEYSCQPSFNRKELLTNYAETEEHWFFWMTLVSCQFQLPEWVPGNGILCMEGNTGYNPGSTVTISLWDNFYGYEFPSWVTVEADMYGRFYLEKRLPELPRHPHTDGSDMHYWVKAVDEYGNGEDSPMSFSLIPWITYEDTLPEENLSWWDTTESGNVYDTILVYGHGFLPSRKDGYDPYSTVWVNIIYTDVAPLESWDYRTVWNGSGFGNFGDCSDSTCLGTDTLSWYPRLSEVILIDVHTDENGYWSAEIQVPQSYGGLHAIYGEEYSIVTDAYQPLPGTPQGDTRIDLVKSGWPEITCLWEEQSVLFDVWPTIEVSPSEVLTDQYVTITGEGLPLPKYYELWKNDSPIYSSRDWCLVIDFGPYEQWVFENKRLRNNEFDQSWAMELWYPFAFYSPDPAWFVEDPESLVWHGKLCSILYDWGYEADPQIHFGSKFMKAPIMQPGEYTVKLYYYDKHMLDFTDDHFASTTVTVMLDSMSTSLVTLEENIATVMTKIGEIQVHISDLNAKVVSIEGTIATVSTDIGVIQTDITNIDAKVISIEGNVATIETSIGFVKESAETLNAAIVSLQEDMVTIHTDVGDLQVKLGEINGIVEIENNIATITTDLGILKGEVTSLVGEVATIKTDIGTIREEADLIKGSVALQPASITLSLIAALAAVAAAALILRKVYLK